MAKKKRKILKAAVSHISLCPKGANKLQTLFKADGGKDDPSFNDIRGQLEGLVSEEFPDEDYVWVRDVFPASKTVVYTADSKNYRQGYDLDKGELVGEPIEVAERSTYFEVTALTKEGQDISEEGLVYGVMYAPDMVDSQNDFADADTIKEIMHGFMKSGDGVDIKHDFKTLEKGSAFVAESFIIQPGDPRFTDSKDYAGNSVDVTGGWGVCIKIDDEDLREKYRSGEFQGLSMGGVYQTEEVEEESVGLIKQLGALLKSFTGRVPQNNEPELEIDMTAEELAKAIQDGTKSVFEGITSRLDTLEKVEKPETKDVPAPEAPEAPTLDLTKVEDIKAHLKALELKKLQAEVDVTDPESLKKYLEKIEGSEAPEADADDKLEKKLDEEKPQRTRTLSKSEASEQSEMDEALGKLYADEDEEAK